MDVICLCEQWCHLCNAYRETFEAFGGRQSAHQFAFVDIEDEADLLDLTGGIDIVDFPTLLVSDAADLRFFGSSVQSHRKVKRWSVSFVKLGREACRRHSPFSDQATLNALLQGIAERHLYLPAPGVKLPEP